MVSVAEREAFRQVYEHYGKDKVLKDDILLYNAIGDLLGAEGKKLRNQLKFAITAGINDLYSKQLDNPTKGFDERVMQLLVDAGLSVESATTIKELYDYMVGFTDEPVEIASNAVSGEIEDSSASNVLKPVESSDEQPKKKERKEKKTKPDRTGAKKKGKMKPIIIAFVALAVIATVSVVYLMPLQKYKKAEQKREIGQFEQAIELFTELGEFGDAQTQVYATYYEKGEKVRFSDRQAALDAYTKAGYYKDANVKLEGLKEEIYQEAIRLYQSGDWEGARAEFSYIPGYNDADAKVIQCDKEIQFAIGKYVTFGTYPQTSDGTDNTPIEWCVLDRNGQSALLVSRYALDCKPYNTNYTGVTWETCTLRKWLNNDFISKAFSSQQQTAILTTMVDNSKNQGYYDTNGGNNTQDKVFLLSYAEAWKYFKSDEARECQPTAYTVKQNAYTDNGKCMWWLRSPGSSSWSAYFVHTNGKRFYFNVSSDHAVRPALWVNLTSDIF